MKSTYLAVILVLACTLNSSAQRSRGSRSSSYSGIGNSSLSKEHVGGYVKRSGTYVAPHSRSTADSTKYNNWSTKGNANPETGKKGYTNPYRTR